MAGDSSPGDEVPTAAPGRNGRLWWPVGLHRPCHAGRPAPLPRSSVCAIEVFPGGGTGAHVSGLRPGSNRLE